MKTRIEQTMSLDEARFFIKEITEDQYNETGKEEDRPEVIIKIEIPSTGPTTNAYNLYLTYLQVYSEFHIILKQSKLDAIKELRRRVPGLGLGDAKYVIEATPLQVCKYVAKYATLDGYDVNKI